MIDRRPRVTGEGGRQLIDWRGDVLHLPSHMLLALTLAPSEAARGSAEPAATETAPELLPDRLAVGVGLGGAFGLFPGGAVEADVWMARDWRRLGLRIGYGSAYAPRIELGSERAEATLIGADAAFCVNTLPAKLRLSACPGLWAGVHSYGLKDMPEAEPKMSLVVAPLLHGQATFRFARQLSLVVRARMVVPLLRPKYDIYDAGVPTGETLRAPNFGTAMTVGLTWEMPTRKQIAERNARSESR